MKYKINSKYADKYKGKCISEGLFLELKYDLRKLDCENDVVSLREGKAQDIDGVVSILLEYGVLEEEECEEDDDSGGKDILSEFFEHIKEHNKKVTEEEYNKEKNIQTNRLTSDYIVIDINGNKKLFKFYEPLNEHKLWEEIGNIIYKFKKS